LNRETAGSQKTPSEVPPITTFGTLYEDKRGTQYIQIGTTGVRADCCRPFRSKVAGVKESTWAGWFAVTLEGEIEEFLLHHNWVNENGELKPGDEVEGLVDTRGCKTFWLLRRASKPMVAQSSQIPRNGNRNQNAKFAEASDREIEDAYG
jgi:hypothetical protein